MNKIYTKFVSKACLLFLSSGLSGFAAANTQDNFNLSESPYISLSGYSTVVATPDRAKFSVKVRAESKKAIDCKQDVDKKVANILTSLKKAGLDRKAVSSAQLWLRPVHRRDQNGNTTFKGYAAERDIEVTVKKLDELGAYLDQMLIEGATDLSNIRLISSKHKEYQEEARRLAADDAAKKALELASEFGAELDRVWSINYVENVNNDNVMLENRMFTASMKTAVPSVPTYNDKSIIFNDRVDVVYKLK
ncbi:26 kDa periplasmic immunogenic protein precursor [Vibrio aerogenes CECT 7868]|uniref:26 kDa periplasmic immunogenic protein n=1 Tax=Vibrio aerogenes CECT 7868 TaxID=1216006 RepID=A0A1M6CYF0_9VIBR|nr:SIMPL domain-containing protein [Vibrio aerogenes]SHI65748.1 26 kDa periplasmic immunogenic protein precursor [Vibrio aerogenes CECT 7868]